MIRTLRKKVIAMSMTVVLLVLLVVGILCCSAAMNACDWVVWDMLQELAETRSEQQTEELGLPLTLTRGAEEIITLTGSAVCTMEVDASGKVVGVTYLTREQKLPRSVLETIARRADSAGGGRWENCWYYRLETPGGTRLAVASGETNLRRALAGQLIRAMLLALIPGLVILLALCWVFSGFAVRPARTALRYQQQFLADAGHELKTPISAISVNAAALEAETGQSKYLDCIQSETQRMSGLIHQMMEAACLEQSAEKIKRQQVDLTSLVYQATLPFECVALERNISYKLEIQKQVSASCDPEKIRQLAAILLDNAFKYVDEGGEVAVCLKADGRHFVFEVGNSGPGIHKEDLLHIFERFYRSDKVRHGNGSYGLGLAIAQTIAREHHGRLTAQSEEGVWTSFRLRI